jgi:hypothetical protein
VEEIGREMKRAGMAKVIIVTSPAHTRRVKALWNKLVGAKQEGIVRARSRIHTTPIIDGGIQAMP